ncbi:MAG: hypothetical protein Kow00122_15100 [Thermoleophilia bacterium]
MPEFEQSTMPIPSPRGDPPQVPLAAGFWYRCCAAAPDFRRSRRLVPKDFRRRGNMTAMSDGVAPWPR